MLETKWISKRAVAEYLGVTTRTVDRLMSRGYDLGKAKIGRLSRYDASKVEQLLKPERKVEVVDAERD